MLTVSGIAELVIGLLAQECGKPAAQMRSELEALGPNLPVDSVLVVEILAKVEEACGVRLQVDAKIAGSTRSVMTFARAVHRALGGADGSAEQ